MLLATDNWDEKTPVEWVPSAVYDRRVHALESVAKRMHSEMRLTQGLSVAAMVVAITLSILATRGLATASDLVRTMRSHEAMYHSTTLPAALPEPRQPAQ